MDIATASELNPHVVEKDYVLGWILWGIYGKESLSSNWVFKGGTCLKKCFFETYRFSEDLDFTLRDQQQIEEGFLSQSLSEVCDSIYEESGIEFPEELRRFDVYENTRGGTSCEVKIAYKGPVSPTGRNAPRIKLDLTADEVIVLPSATPTIYHPYADIPSSGINVVSYSYEEVFAEKVRALGERTRPRDLYDVINLYRNDEARPEHSIVLDTLRQKCEFKGIEIPTMQELEPHLDNLAGSWAHMLEHQLPTLPPLQSFWDALPDFFAWLSGELVPAVLSSYTGDPSDEIIQARTGFISGLGSAQSSIDMIRFAASNRLCVQLDYQNKTRLIEPYSLRRTRDGNVILHTHSLESDEHRSYRVDRIQGARVTDQTFNPRHLIELTAAGPIPIPKNVVSPG
jgi:predicted nucleotidyltransferase component of viral defense system